MLSRLEGIIPALETAHAIAWINSAHWSTDDLVLVCLSGRGDKDMAQVAELGVPRSVTSARATHVGRGGTGGATVSIALVTDALPSIRQGRPRPTALFSEQSNAHSAPWTRRATHSAHCGRDGVWCNCRLPTASSDGWVTQWLMSQAGHRTVCPGFLQRRRTRADDAARLRGQ